METRPLARGALRSIDVLGAFSVAADLALGLQAGHGVRATYIGMHIAEELGLPRHERVDLFYAELLMDAGCTAWASHIATTVLGDDIAARREQPAVSIPLISRIVYATIFLELFHQLGGREAAMQLARGRRGKTLDPVIVDAFLRLAERDAFWAGLEDESVLLHVRDIEPGLPARYLSADRLDDVARAFADFADLKSMFSPVTPAAWRHWRNAWRRACRSRASSARRSGVRPSCMTSAWSPCRRLCSTSRAAN